MTWRDRIEEAIIEWIKYDAPQTVKMRMMPEDVKALANRIERTQPNKSEIK